MKIHSEVLNLLHVDRQTDRQTDRQRHGKLIGALLQVSAVNMLKYFQAWLQFQQHYFQYNVDGC
jgi:hypothetical protein